MEMLAIEFGLALSLGVGAYCMWRVENVRRDHDWMSGDVLNHSIRLNNLDGGPETTTNRNVRLARETVAKVRGGQHVEPPAGIVKPPPPPPPPPK